MGRGTTETGERAALEELATTWHVRLTDQELAGLLRFAELLMQWNARINLTGARTAGGLIEEHFPDSFAVASVLAEPAHVVDVGSGGGLPAIPLAIVRPALRLTMVEPLAKKAAFLRTAVRELGLAGRAMVEARRVEDLPGGGFDVAMSRATFAPGVWAELAGRLVRPGGRVLVLTVPGGQVRGRGLAYFDGRRELVQVAPAECST